MEDNCSKVVGTLYLKLVEILINLLDGYSNTRLKEGVVLVLKLLLSLKKVFMKRI